MKDYIVGTIQCLFLVAGILTASYGAVLYKCEQPQTQAAIQTAIVSVRGCDIIQYIQDDKLVTAFPAPDQPKTCKMQQPVVSKKK